jgi:hypothetical protein
LRFDRNRVRRLLVPALATSLNPRAARHLVRAAGRLREDAEYLDVAAAEALATCIRAARGGRLALDAARLGALAAPIGRRVARLALERAGVDGRRVAERHVAALLDLARGRPGRSADLPGGVAARRARELLLERRRRSGGRGSGGV